MEQNENLFCGAIDEKNQVSGPIKNTKKTPKYIKDKVSIEDANTFSFTPIDSGDFKKELRNLDQKKLIS